MSDKHQQRQNDQRFFLQSQAEQIRQLCLEGYAAHGRGAVVLDEKESGPGRSLAIYIAASILEEKGLPWPDSWTEKRVQSYDPEHEFVIVFAYLDGEVYCMKGHFAEGSERRN